MSNKYLEKMAGFGDIGRVMSGANIRAASKTQKHFTNVAEQLKGVPAAGNAHGAAATKALEAKKTKWKEVAKTGAVYGGLISSSYGISKTASDNKYLEKASSILSSALGAGGRRIGIGSSIGAVTGGVGGAVSAKDGEKLKGAIIGATGGAALGGVAGSLFGRKVMAMKPLAPKQITTSTGHPDIQGFGTSRGSSSLAKKMTGFTDV